MNNIIGPSQNGFIEGRQILDPVLTANEVVISVNANKVVEDYRAKKKKGWILKLDLKKAFDCIDWGFLENNALIGVS